MQVELDNVSKTYQNHAIFKGVNLVIPAGFKGVVLGGNGSGKSTLLKIMSGALVPSTGSITLRTNGKTIPESDAYKHIAFCAPYSDLIDDFTLTELLSFQQRFKPFLTGVSIHDIIDLLYLKKFQHKPIKVYSSGMKQRVRLALTVLRDVPVLLLDEPTSNLDPEGKSWYRWLIETYLHNRTLIVASNYLEEEYFFATTHISLSTFQ